MANIIYKNFKQGNIELSKKVIERIYLEADSCMAYANAYNTNLENDRKVESEIIESLINGTYAKAQELLNKRYNWLD